MEPGQPTPGAQEHLLRHFLGLARVEPETPQSSVDPVSMSGDELRERVLVARARAVDQLVFGNRGARGQAGNPNTARERTARSDAVRRESSAHVQLERDRADAESLARLAGAVGENMSEVPP